MGMAACPKGRPPLDSGIPGGNSLAAPLPPAYRPIAPTPGLSSGASYNFHKERANSIRSDRKCVSAAARAIGERINFFGRDVKGLAIS